MWNHITVFSAQAQILQWVIPGLKPFYTMKKKSMHKTESYIAPQNATEDLDPETAELWFAGKQLIRGRQLGEHVGRNDKTKAVVRLQGKGNGPPVREPVCPALQLGVTARTRSSQRLGAKLHLMPAHIECCHVLDAIADVAELF